MPPPNDHPPPSGLVARLGHLALWAGLYVGAALAGAAILAGVPDFGAAPPDRVAVLCAIFTGISVYLLDRVKLADRWLDPADRDAHPERWGFLQPRRRHVRSLAGVSGALGFLTAWLLAPWLVIVIAGAFVGAWIYAGRPPAPDRPPRRVKDVLVVKNLAVGASITLFAIVLLRAARPDAGTPAGLAITGVALLLVVFADAALCDLDDVGADRRFGTRTIPHHLSTLAVWILATALHALAGVLAIGARPTLPVMILGAGLPVTTIAIGAARPWRVRDVIDVRLPLLVSIALGSAHLA